MTSDRLHPAEPISELLLRQRRLHRRIAELAEALDGKADAAGMEVIAVAQAGNAARLAELGIWLQRQASGAVPVPVPAPALAAAPALPHGAARPGRLLDPRFDPWQMVLVGLLVGAILLALCTARWSAAG